MRLKNSVKRMVGVVLAMVMVMSMSMSVFAAGTDISVTVTLDAVSDGTHPALHGTKTVYVAPGTDVETIVKQALPGLGLNITQGYWKVVPDWVNPSITYNALDGLYINGTAPSDLHYQGKAYESDVAYYGVGWTYSGFDGSSPLDENNYMSQNTISIDGSSVALKYSNYYYPKTA
ncbi:hypothetical protein [Novisyntrophococcus fermenticellae]|uniref:hypothetical protein n=1 Tax=Novisyntrophococcus fermenticellae TaxID=2068655 RepID=UPI001E309E39|nr:hypothetical protein [Novisyntrophococcus fermenticellae]